MARKLKVFRTSIGFHDAYVAAPSQQAALEAWGSSTNLFGTGLAEQVTDPKLVKGPLAAPGQVIKVKRGSQREHLAALPRTKPAAGSSPRSKHALSETPKPRPRRTALDRAEKALSAAEAERDAQVDAIDAEIEVLQKRRRALIDRHGSRISELEGKREHEADRYDAAIAEWRDL